MKMMKLAKTAIGIGQAMLGRMAIAAFYLQCLRTSMIGDIHVSLIQW